MRPAAFAVGKGLQLALTARDEEMLETLASRVRVLSIEQITRNWFENRRSALARLRALKRAGLVQAQSALIHPELNLSAPVLRWTPGDPEPKFANVARRVQMRWTEHVQPHLLFFIEERASARFGGPRVAPLRTDELTHDVHVAAIYLWYRDHHPELSLTWAGERVLKQTGRVVRGGPVPDASVGGRGAQRFVEFAGAYSVQRLQTFHDFARDEKTPYEFW